MNPSIDEILVPGSNPNMASLRNYLRGTTADTITIGAGGDQPTLVAGLDRLRGNNIRAQTTLSIIGHNTPDTDGGSMTVPAGGYAFDHPQSEAVFIQGPAFSGGQGPFGNASMTGNQATDTAFAKSRFGATLRIAGPNDLTGTNGIAFRNGLGGINRLFVECRNRYNLDFGFNGSHSQSQGWTNFSVENCAIMGNVWSIIGRGVHVVFRGTQNFIGYNKSGGPIDAVDGSVIRVATGFLDLFTVGSFAGMPKYGINLEASILRVDASPTCGIRMKGPFVHGVRQMGGFSEARDIQFDGVLQPWTVERGEAYIGKPNISNADMAQLHAAVSATQFGIIGNSGTFGLIHSGMGAIVNHGGATIENCIANRYISALGGRFVGYDQVAVNNSRAAIAAMDAEMSMGNALNIAVTNPKAASNDIISVGNGASIHLYGKSGVSLYHRTAGSYAAATANTFYKGSIITE